MGHLITLLSEKKKSVSDAFNRPDDALSLGKADTGQAWQTAGASWGLGGGKAYCLDPLTTGYAYQDCDADGIASLDVKFSVNEGLAFRYVDALNQLTARVGSGGLNLFKNTAGTNTSIGAYGYTPVVGSWYNIRISFFGSLIRVYLDGVERITVTETYLQTATKCGLKASNSTAGEFDNFDFVGA